jgi:hypothetical protein
MRQAHRHLFLAISILLQLAIASMASAAAPALSLKEAVRVAEDFVTTEKIDVSRHYLASIRIVTDNSQAYWDAQWMPKDTQIKGGWFIIRVQMDKSSALVPGK